MSRATNQIAEQLAQEGAADTAKRQGDTQVLGKMNALAWAILEIQIAEPTVKAKDIAKRLQTTPVTVSRIVNSPCYDLEMRRLRNNALIGKLLEAAEKGIGAMTDIFADEEADNKDKIEATKTVFTALGMGANQGNSGVNINVNNSNGVDATSGVTREMVEAAAQRRREKVINAKKAEGGDE